MGLIAEAVVEIAYAVCQLLLAVSHVVGGAIVFVLVLWTISATAALVIDAIDGALVSPALRPAYRVRIGATEWECHDMRDGSQVLLPRGGGAKVMVQSQTNAGATPQRSVVTTGPNRWLRLSTARQGAFHETTLCGEAYKCSRATADKIAERLRRSGHTAAVEPA